MDTDQKKKIAAEWYRKGSEAMAREDWDYAIEAFNKSVELVPDNLMYRQILRGCQERKYDNNKTGAKMAGMRLMKVRGRIKKCKMQKKWDAVERAAEAGLAVNPWDAHLNADLARACRELGYDEVAKFAYERAVSFEPNNKEFNRALAALLEERGDYSAATGLWQRVYKLDPTDGEARSKTTQLGASSIIDRDYDKAASTRDVKQSAYDLDRPARAGAPQAVDGPGVSAEADLQRAIRKDESDPNNYLKLAELYKREKRLDEAEQTLQKAVQVSGGDQNIRELLEDVQLDQLRHNLELAREAATQGDGDETARQNAAALANELLNREIEVLGSRVERYPQDTRLKFELGKRFMRQQKWGQAIPLLQRASADSRLEGRVLTSLGECFLNDGKATLARRQFEKAIEKVNPHDHPDLFKKCHYLLGRLCEKAGQREQAENHYNEVLGVDYEYRDTVKRLEALQSGD